MLKHPISLVMDIKGVVNLSNRFYNFFLVIFKRGGGGIRGLKGPNLLQSGLKFE